MGWDGVDEDEEEEEAVMREGEVNSAQ